MAGTSCALGRFEHNLPLLAPLGGGRLWTGILVHLARKPKGQLRFVDSTFIMVHQAGQSAIG